MQKSDILEPIVQIIEDRIGKEWRHDAFILGWSSEHINFEIDGKEYVLNLHEVMDGRHFCEVPDTAAEIMEDEG